MFKISLFIFLLIGFTVSHAAPIEITGVAATVNGKVVTKKEVRSLLAPTIELLRTKYPRGGEAFEIDFEKAREAVLDQLIENKIILSELEDQDARIPDTVVEGEVKRIVNEFFNGSEAEFRESLKESGTTMRSFRKAQKEKILVQAFKSEQFGRELAPPTPEEITAQYNKRKTEYRDRTKDKISFSKIFIPSQTGDLLSTPEKQLALAEDLATQLRAGANFSATAKKHSADAYAEDGGVWPETNRVDLEPSFAELLFQSSTGEINGPYKDPRGFTIVKVNKKIYGPSPPKSKIKDRLAKEIEAEKYEKQFKRWMDTLKKKAMIDRRM